jgi:hypothetical protein
MPLAGHFSFWWPGATSKNPWKAASALDFGLFVKIGVQAGVQALNCCFYNKKWTRTIDQSRFIASLLAREVQNLGAEVRVRDLFSRVIHVCVIYACQATLD